jgi:hypothetical protein
LVWPALTGLLPETPASRNERLPGGTMSEAADLRRVRVAAPLVPMPCHAVPSPLDSMCGSEHFPWRSHDPGVRDVSPGALL